MKKAVPESDIGIKVILTGHFRPEIHASIHVGLTNSGLLPGMV